MLLSTLTILAFSHRPIHVKNYYNHRQVKLITLNEKTDDIPKFEDIFRDESVSYSAFFCPGFAMINSLCICGLT